MVVLSIRSGAERALPPSPTKTVRSMVLKLRIVVMERERLISSDNRCSRMGAERGRLPSPIKMFSNLVPWSKTLEMPKAKEQGCT